MISQGMPHMPGRIVYPSLFRASFVTAPLHAGRALGSPQAGGRLILLAVSWRRRAYAGVSVR